MVVARFTEVVTDPVYFTLLLLLAACLAPLTIEKWGGLVALLLIVAGVGVLVLSYGYGVWL